MTIILHFTVNEIVFSHKIYWLYCAPIGEIFPVLMDVHQDNKIISQILESLL